MHSWSVFSLSIKMTITWQTPPFPLCSNSVVFVRCAYKLISSLFLFCVRVANPIRRIVRAEQADCSLDLISTLKCSLRERNWHAGWVITCFWRKKKKKVAAHTWRLTPFSISSAEISFYSLQTNIFVSKKTKISLSSSFYSRQMEKQKKIYQAPWEIYWLHWVQVQDMNPNNLQLSLQTTLLNNNNIFLSLLKGTVHPKNDNFNQEYSFSHL